MNRNENNERLKVLLVEDHKILREEFEDLLNDQPDMEAHGVDTGEAAIEYVRENPVDIVLMDISLPGMTGVQALLALLETQPEIKIVGLSSHTEKAIVLAFIGSGGKGYIDKSQAGTDLLPAIRSVVRGERFISEALHF